MPERPGQTTKNRDLDHRSLVEVAAHSVYKEHSGY
jgi:hypothetical protein